MLKKLTNKKGFTLMEMLIVVAIIAILVVIAIPTFNSAMAKSRAATDVANIRSGYAAAQVEAMTEGVQGNNSSVTYTLLKDGTVTSSAPASGTSYTTQGSSDKAAPDTTIGGKFAVGDGGLTWTKGSSITYTVTVGDDGVATVTKINDATAIITDTTSGTTQPGGENAGN